MTRCVALSGGVGGAKLALGLSKVLSDEELLVVANTGDDFEHLGLSICPDIDTLLYTLGGIANPKTGWGRAEESWRVLDALKEIGGEAWFQLGDKDLSLHMARTGRLASGASLSRVTQELAKSLGISPEIIPMCDAPVRTIVETDIGPLPFQHYFVKNRCEPVVSGFQFAGADQATPNPRFVQALKDPALDVVIICPSNPFISIDPILSLPGLKQALAHCRAPIVAVSPIVGGHALKGPAAKMLKELGLRSDATAIADHYGDLLDGFVIDTKDADLAAMMKTENRRILVTNTVMESLDHRITLARDILSFATDLRAAR
ncbi:MAG: 2-phospho-L-lactate transferase [Proteobacteria bacterium]|nr:2-phospho-L-lactate transferase [Pseudomonadota bacterium]